MRLGAIANLSSELDPGREQDRERLLAQLNGEWENTQDRDWVAAARRSNARAEAMMKSPLRRALDWQEEPATLRKEYGDRFGINCLLARRLVEAGCPYVEVGMGGWDMHSDIFGNCKRMLPALDAGVGTLLQDLQDRELLRDVVVILATERGRTPQLNAGKARDVQSSFWRGDCCRAAASAVTRDPTARSAWIRFRFRISSPPSTGPAGWTAPGNTSRRTGASPTLRAELRLRSFSNSSPPELEEFPSPRGRWMRDSALK